FDTLSAGPVGALVLPMLLLALVTLIVRPAVVLLNVSLAPLRLIAPPMLTVPPLPPTVTPVQLEVPVIEPPRMIVPAVMPLMLTIRCAFDCASVPLYVKNREPPLTRNDEPLLPVIAPPPTVYGLP